VWILGSSGGQSAEVAGANGLRFAANYHVSPATVIEAVEGYRAAFRPSADLDRPYVSVSADVVVADDEATDADELIVTTITHDHADRVRSHQLLAEEWHRRH
jgi:alkanesulfonate monooxygenase SsuD/methylene tetrahydromethanopterin reductase-like flavin-dependent oxidoreductase (luciferase family)